MPCCIHLSIRSRSQSTRFCREDGEITEASTIPALFEVPQTSRSLICAAKREQGFPATPGKQDLNKDLFWSKLSISSTRYVAFGRIWSLHWHPVTTPSIGTKLCTEHRCCQSSLLGYWARPRTDLDSSPLQHRILKWLNQHSKLLRYSFCHPQICHPQKDDNPS